MARANQFALATRGPSYQVQLLVNLPRAVRLQARGAVGLLGLAPDRHLLLELPALVPRGVLALPRGRDAPRRATVIPGDRLPHRRGGGRDLGRLVLALLLLVQVVEDLAGDGGEREPLPGIVVVVVAAMAAVVVTVGPV